jgi:hypothetical protein
MVIEANVSEFLSSTLTESVLNHVDMILAFRLNKSSSGCRNVIPYTIRVQ